MQGFFFPGIGMKTNIFCTPVWNIVVIKKKKSRCGKH